MKNEWFWIILHEFLLVFFAISFIFFRKGRSLWSYEKKKTVRKILIAESIIKFVK